ncbi:hypothetical protein [Streptomyces chryseus]
MPRQQNTAAQRAREAQRKTGGKYTTLFRNAGAPPKRIAFRDLLTECSTLPEVSVNWGYHPDYEHAGPRMFRSEVLGGPMPYGTVLALAGELSGVNLGAPLGLESHSPLETAIVSCQGRRFELMISQDGVYELCRTTGCLRHPVSTWAIPWCSDHLTRCSADVLFEMAREWGYGCHEAHNRQPDGASGSVEGDSLIRAAVATGAFTEVSKALVEACFEDPDLIDDVYWDAEVAMAVRHGMDREKLRLTKVASAEAARLRKVADGSCAACGQSLARHPQGWSVPPQFCSAECVPASPPQPRPDDPWVVPTAGQSI